MKARDIALRVVVSIAAVACGGAEDDHGGHGSVGEPSGATCSVNSALTYESFGRDFMAQYCTSCHSSSLRGAERNGAPSDHNFDTLDAIQDVGAEHIDGLAAAGPAHVNTAMPPHDQDAKPSEMERRLLGEWLACGIP